MHSRNKLRLAAISAAVGLTLSAGPAQAGALAQAVLDVSNLLFLRAGGGAFVAGGTTPDFGLLVSRDTSDGSAVLNGITANGSASIAPPTTFTMDMAEVKVGTSVNGANDFSLRSMPTTTNVARVDTLLAGSPVEFRAPNDVVIQPANGGHAQAVAEVQVQPGDGSSQGNMGLQSSFSFVLAQGGGITLSFDALRYVIAALSADSVPGLSSAQATTDWILTVDLPGVGTIIRWKPNGASDAGGLDALGIVAETDPFSLSGNAGTLFPGVTSGGTSLSGGFSATSIALLANTPYELSIRHTVSADATQAVIPEPGSIALLGFGLMGLAAVRRRKAV